MFSTLSTLLLMPWCRIDKAYEVGCVNVLPFERHKPIDGLDDAAQCRVNTIMATYKTIEGKPVDRAALVRYDGRSPIDDLNEAEVDTVYELVALACFCGLAKREYFNPLGSYCNSDCFALYVQKFAKADFTTLTTRRREGQTLSVWPIDHIAITIPTHCHPVETVGLGEALLGAITAHRARSKNDEWARWQNSISCFNLANTDGENVRYQVEWVLLCSAFEHLLGAKSEAKDVAGKFSEAMVPGESFLARNANRRSDRWTDDGESLRYEWMREFYRIRGDFAHGKLDTEQPAVWNSREHLVLATIAFPLVVKCLLERACTYEPTDDDRAQIDSFEKFADISGFLRPPSGQENSLDSRWKRICDDRKSKLAFDEAREECKAKGLIPQEGDDAISTDGDSAGEDG